MPRSSIGLLLLAVVLLAVLFAAGVPFYVRSRAARLDARCANNLSQLWKMEYGYKAQFGGPNKLFPATTGGDFWLCLMRTPVPLVDESIATDIYSCPTAPSAARLGTTHYRGPASDVNAYPERDPVGTCMHTAASMIVLYGTSDVMTVSSTSPGAQDALRMTRP
jgi:hypothetical protein